VIGFVGDNFSLTRFRGCRAEEGDRALGWSPGQARAHTGEVGVGVRRARRRAVGCLGSASLRAARTGTAGWATLFSWAASSQLGHAGVGAGCWVSAHSQFCYLKFLFSKSVYNLQTNLNSIQI
jgi:hypothetical protein